MKLKIWSARIVSTAMPIGPCSDMTEAVHTAEEENAVKVVKGEAEIGEDECDENIMKSDEGEGCAIECEDLICAPCEDPDAIDADVDIEAMYSGQLLTQASQLKASARSTTCRTFFSGRVAESVFLEGRTTG